MCLPTGGSGVVFESLEVIFHSLSLSRALSPSVDADDRLAQRQGDEKRKEGVRRREMRDRPKIAETRELTPNVPVPTPVHSSPGLSVAISCSHFRLEPRMNIIGRSQSGSGQGSASH